MRQEDTLAWERRMLAEHDLDDLAGCVQLLRTLGWSAALSLKIGREAMVWFEDLEKFPPLIAKLQELARGGGEEGALAASVARLYGRVHAALLAGPRRPSEAEVVRRYVDGEIGDRTAQYVLGVDAWGLIEVCQRHGLPPIQIGSDDG